MYFYKMDRRAQPPKKSNKRDSGWDLYALEEVRVRPGEVVTVRTGLVLGMDCQGLILDKSGRGSAGLKTLGGVIDEGYVGEIKIIVTNTNLWPIIKNLIGLGTLLESTIDESTIVIPPDKAVAQIIFDSGVVGFTELDEDEFKFQFSHYYGDSERGTKGFGSSDTH